MRYLDFFDDVYYINLDSRLDRKEKFEERSKNVGINAIRFSAIQPKIEDCSHIAWWPKNGTDKQKRLKANEYGTALSHLAIVKEAKERNLENVFIFEDDCIFLDNFKEEVEKCVNDLKNIEWDIIYFGGEPNHYCVEITDNLVDIGNGGVYGLQSYAVNKRFYDTFLDMSKTFDRGAIIDIYLIHRQPPRKYILSKKLLTLQETNYSDLRESIVETSHFIRGWEKFVTNAMSLNFKQNTSDVDRLFIINNLIKKFNLESYLDIMVYDSDVLHKCDAKIKQSINSENVFQFFNNLNLDVKYDIILVDGWHEYNMIYNDIINSLKHLKMNGFIIIHDCCPYIKTHALPYNNGGTWLGENFRAYINIANKYDIKYLTVDSDWGCGILFLDKEIDFSSQKKDVLEEMPECWDFFDSNRKLLLNLVEPEIFKEHFKNESWLNLFKI